MPIGVILYVRTLKECVCSGQSLCLNSGVWGMGGKSGRSRAEEEAAGSLLDASGLLHLNSVWLLRMIQLEPSLLLVLGPFLYIFFYTRQKNQVIWHNLFYTF